MSQNPYTSAKRTQGRSATVPAMLAVALEHHRAGRFAEAEQAYLQVLACQPRHAESLHLLGLLAAQSGRHTQAAELIRTAISIDPNAAIYHSHLGNVLLTLRKLDEAAAEYRCALALRPTHAEDHYDLGVTLRAQGRLLESVASYERALSLKPQYPSAHYGMGNALKDLGDFERAIEHYREALALSPDNAEIANNLGNALQLAGKLDLAATHYMRALQLKPNYAAAHSNLGDLLRFQGRLAESIASCQRAVELNPKDPHFCNNLGAALEADGHMDEAVVQYRRALTLEPDMAGAHSNIGNILHHRGELEEALAHFDRALELDPQCTKALFNKSLNQLLRGDLSAGFANYESRFQVSVPGREALRKFAQPRWRGESLNGERILLHAEQGLGDTLQMLRYIPMVQARGGRVILEVPVSLRRLVELQRWDMEFIAEGDSPSFQWECPLMSLPLALRTNLDSIPAQVPYLIVPEEARLAAASLPWPTDGLRVGLVWAGNPKHAKDRFRSIPIDQLQPLFRLPKIHFFSLQVGTAAQGISASEGAMTDLGRLVEDMADTAALIERLDLVITVDTAVAHLAGALAKSVWIMLPYTPDWRWLLHRNDSPWYPSMRLFRQPVLDDWQSAVAEMEGALANFSHECAGPIRARSATLQSR
jgi:tetratricopeptide (TPR) repeat protein